MITAGSGLALAAATGLSRSAFAQADAAGTTVQADGYAYIAADPNLTIWTQLVTAGGLEQAARGAAPYTVMPASDSAFADYPNIVKQLLGYQNTTGTHNSMDAFPDNSKIVKLVRSHIIRGKHYPSEIMGKKVTVTSIAGTPITIDATNPQAVTVSWTSAANGQPLTATVTEPPVTCTNCVVYVVDKIEDVKGM